MVAGWYNATDVGILQSRLQCRGRSDVTESKVTTRSPFCGYNTIHCVELNGEDSSCYSNKTESVSLRKFPYDH